MATLRSMLRPLAGSTMSPVVGLVRPAFKFALPRTALPRPRFQPSRLYSTPPPEAPLSLSQRLKQMSKQYGYTAVGVYLALSALDFPFCFLAVRLLGTERVGHYEEVAVRWAKGLVGKEISQAEEEERREREKKEASIWTELALAYAVHKSLIFLRVPLTAAILPKVVKTLRRWGWQVGSATKKTVEKAAK